MPYIGSQEEVVGLDVAVDKSKVVDGRNGYHRLCNVEASYRHRGEDRVQQAGVLIGQRGRAKSALVSSSKVSKRMSMVIMSPPGRNSIIKYRFTESCLVLTPSIPSG